MNSEGREDQPVIVGRCVGVYAARGWLKILSYTRPEENIFEYQPWLIGQHNRWRSVRLVDGKLQDKHLVASVAGINDRDEARTVVGSDIAVQRSQLSVLEADEFYCHDLLGLQVVDAEGETLGVVVDVVETGANDVLVMSSDVGRFLIPYVRDLYIKHVDLKQGVVSVDWQLMLMDGEADATD